MPDQLRRIDGDWDAADSALTVGWRILREGAVSPRYGANASRLASAIETRDSLFEAQRVNARVYFVRLDVGGERRICRLAVGR